MAGTAGTNAAATKANAGKKQEKIIIEVRVIYSPDFFYATYCLSCSVLVSVELK
jgi:hypothetical protein